MLFIDLRKAYDSIPRSPNWRVLETYGNPPALLSIIRSLHDDMKAEVTVGGNDQRLIGEKTRKPDRLKISELLFADDAVAVGTSRRSTEAAATVLEELISAWGLSLNISKTKLLVAGTPHSEDLQPLQLAGESVECVCV